MGKRKEIGGRRFGKLVAVDPSHKDDHHQWWWNTVCDCGTKKSIRTHDLLSGKTASCGCIVVKHGAARGGKVTPEYMSWRGMLARCENSNATGYENYGGRGIKVCETWHKFENFLADMGERPGLDYSIDRIDGERGYEPGNCRWATTTEQNQNKRDLVMMTVDGETTFLAEWARRSGIPEATMRRRVQKLGWDHARAVKTPVRGKKRDAA